jgi:hypothetical protein
MGVSRRDFLRLLAAGGMTSLLAACYPEAIQVTPTRSPIPTQSPTALPTLPSTPTTTLAPKSILQRIRDRSFPSTFMAWRTARNLSKGFGIDAARYDLAITNEWIFDLQWQSSYPGQGVSFVPYNLLRGRVIHASLLRNNPNMLVLAAVRFRDAPLWWLPEESPFWGRDSSGRHVLSGTWGENYYMLQWHDASSRTRVAAQARACTESGIFDGVFLDGWDDGDPDLVKMLEEVRNAIGTEKLILVNNNTSRTPNAAPYVNGLFMEACFWSQQLQSAVPPLTPTDWQTISDTLLWAEATLREPRVNALETWCVASPSELNRLRATTTLSLTHSDGYALFANNNHEHNWDSFWDHRELGRPIDRMTTRSDAAIQREFDGGTVIYNPMGNGAVTVTFAEPRVSAAIGQTSLTFVLEPMDGDLYIKTA